MRIGVVGAGWLGGTVGGALSKAGHDVLFSSRRPDKLAAMVRKLGPHTTAGTPAEAAAFGEVVLIATPYGELEKIGHDLGGALQGKIVLDACNPYPPDPEPFRREIEKAGVAISTAKYFPGARLVRAFSAVDATSVEASAAGRGAKLGVPLASDDKDALRVAEHLVRDAGCEPVTVGDFAAARSFQRGGPGFRANTSAAALRKRLGLPAVSGS
jgi:predicted dinucleotide-binding enzyme